MDAGQRRLLLPPVASAEADDTLLRAQRTLPLPVGDAQIPQRSERGHVVVVGVWKPEQIEAIENLDRLYKAYGANPRFRFLGVANDHTAKPAYATFPVVYNQGSKIFGAQAGEFVLLDESGRIALRGSLVKDIDTLSRQLRESR